MFKRVFIMSVIAAVAALHAIECFAVYPAVSHTAKTRGYQNWTYTLNYSYEYEEADKDGAVTRTQEFHNVLTYGIHERVDMIVVNVPFEYKTHPDGTEYKGIDDITLEAKWKFYDKDDLHIAIYPEITFPTGNYKTGDGEGRSTYGGILIVTQDLAPFSFSLSGEYLRNENRKKDRINIWKVYFAPSVKISDKFSILTSVGLERDTDRTNKKIPVYVTGGFRYALTDFLSVSPVFKAGFNKRETDITFIMGTTFKY